MFGGKGWAPGSPTKSVLRSFQDERSTHTVAHSFLSIVNYAASSFSVSGNAYISVYGWLRGTPFIEYFIIENFGNYNPINGATFVGTTTSDGATYDLAFKTTFGIPGIPASGPVTIKTLYSVRRNKRTRGTVTVGNHFVAWTNAGLGPNSGHTSEWQLVACGASQSTGQCTVNVL